MKYFIVLIASAFLWFSSVAQVGIGTTSPSEALDIESSDASITGIDINNTSTGDPLVHFQVSGTSAFTIGVDNSDASKFKIGTTALATGTSVTIDTNGDVGIGDTDPANVLEVEGPININGTAANTDFYKYAGNHILSAPNTRNLYAGESAGALFDATGTDNVYLGYNAGILATSGDKNVVMGSYAGDALTTGYENTIVGYVAGSSLTTGFYNTYIGSQAGTAATTGRFNTGLGCFNHWRV